MQRVKSPEQEAAERYQAISVNLAEAVADVARDCELSEDARARLRSALTQAAGAARAAMDVLERAREAGDA